MIFTEQKARELAERHNVPPATLKSWRYRGRIPDYYLRDSLETVTEDQASALVAILANQWLVVAQIAGEENSHHFRDAAMGKTLFFVSEWRTAVRALKSLSADLEKWINTEQGIRDFLTKERRVKKEIVKKAAKSFYWRFYSNRNCFISESEIEAISAEFSSLLKDIKEWLENL